MRKVWRKRLRALARRLLGTTGQTLVEFAIVVPTMVMVILFAIYFYEAIQIKLKVQEAARYAAWEFTGRQLHDYRQGGGANNRLYGSALGTITADTTARFADLNSNYAGAGPRRYFTAGFRFGAPRIVNSTVPAIPGGGVVNFVWTVLSMVIDLMSARALMDSVGNPVAIALVGGFTSNDTGLIRFGARLNRWNPPAAWGFNQRGLIEVEASATITNMFLPRSTTGRGGGWFRNALGLPPITVRERVTLVVDDWGLEDGAAINGEAGRNQNTAYWKQVDRMAWVNRNARTFMDGWSRATTTLLSVVSGGAIFSTLHVNPMETALAANVYRGGPGNMHSGARSMIEDVDPGARTTRYDTLPDETSPRPSQEEGTRRQRGEWFMGCPQEEMLGCARSLASRNPFGDFVVPPEGR